MKTTTFPGTQMRIESYDPYERIKVVVIPTLSAYAVEHSEFIPTRDIDSGYHQFNSDSDFEIDGDRVIFLAGFSTKFGGFESSRLTIHYHGIREYTALFPQITDIGLKTRLGQFYEEAEVTFEEGAWLSFELMAAAIYEGLLAWNLQLSDGKFSKLIDLALGRNIIGDREAAVLHRAREYRNLVHAARHGDPYVQRAAAMDTRITLDGLIRKLSSG